MILNLLAWSLFGLMVGAIVRLLAPGPDPMGCLGTVLLGVAGSVLGGYVGHLVWGTADEKFKPAGFLGAILGGLVVMLLLRILRRRTT
ncbi:MAG: GlsB/YeaQ/YmgE family stress response membrane protein [Pirellulales bacterium]